MPRKSVVTSEVFNEICAEVESGRSTILGECRKRGVSPKTIRRKAKAWGRKIPINRQALKWNRNGRARTAENISALLAEIRINPKGSIRAWTAVLQRRGIKISVMSVAGIIQKLYPVRANRQDAILEYSLSSLFIGGEENTEYYKALAAVAPHLGSRSSWLSLNPQDPMYHYLMVTKFFQFLSDRTFLHQEEKRIQTARMEKPANQSLSTAKTLPLRSTLEMAADAFRDTFYSHPLWLYEQSVLQPSPDAHSETTKVMRSLVHGFPQFRFKAFPPSHFAYHQGQVAVWQLGSQILLHLSRQDVETYHHEFPNLPIHFIPQSARLHWVLLAPGLMNNQKRLRYWLRRGCQMAQNTALFLKEYKRFDRQQAREMCMLTKNREELSRIAKEVDKMIEHQCLNPKRLAYLKRRSHILHQAVLAFDRRWHTFINSLTSLKLPLNPSTLPLVSNALQSQIETR